MYIITARLISVILQLGHPFVEPRDNFSGGSCEDFHIFNLEFFIIFIITVVGFYIRYTKFKKAPLVGNILIICSIIYLLIFIEGSFLCGLAAIFSGFILIMFSQMAFYIVFGILEKVYKQFR